MVAEEHYMRTYTKLMSATLAALIVLAFGVGTSTASNGLEVSPQVFSVLSAALSFVAGEFNVICEVLRVYSLHRSIPKVAGTLAGYVTNVIILRCQNGDTVRVLNFPWHIRYVGFGGTLPRISEVRFQVEGTAFLITTAFGFGRCLYGGTVEGFASLEAGGRVTSITAEGTAGLLVDLSLGACPSSGTVRGILDRFLNRIIPTVRLI